MINTFNLTSQQKRLFTKNDIYEQPTALRNNICQ